MRARILEAGAELGWRPRQIARQLRAGTSDVLGLLLADVANPGYADLASGVITRASERGYQVLVSEVGVNGEKLVETSTAHVDRQSAGLLFTSLLGKDKAFISDLMGMGIPFVQVARTIEGIDADSIAIDNFKASRELGVHVATIGRRRVAILGGPEGARPSHERARGFLEGLATGNVDIVNASDVWGPLTRESGAARAAAALDRFPDLDGFVCGNDVVALGALDTCYARGINVPNDVVVTGFDGLSFTSIGPWRLTTVSVPREWIGQRAVDLLVDRIEGSESPAVEETGAYELRIGTTTV